MSSEAALQRIQYKMLRAHCIAFLSGKLNSGMKSQQLPANDKASTLWGCHHPVVRCQGHDHCDHSSSVRCK